MAKKAKKKAEAVESDKVPFQVRFDRDLHQELVKLSEQTGISVNQLVQGMCRGALSSAQVGQWNEFGMMEGDKPTRFLISKPAKGCVWFGSKGIFDSDVPEITDRGTFWFGIDIRERGDVHFGVR
ncbi:hypothetical protein ETAA8_06760 [Anatilimnocola aggregata]|uniref:Uncharacterized protein n=1 Tax=Anatilimnocola aggregata TaxID=2528021 RepID=A0A517Y5X2_9BACT|nr:hypothetical protein [Anatilimnocola aggregata]QDU25606.1 hypothetical protein ETAA8_06760 [Anatilimnocola aggregata]